uniref:NADH-ubiquinone oxidoreductase 19 kDa subunit n=1 Tax=Arundo donax TaxID=35708 RepID=A0A0A9F990_ARUDO
MGDHELGLSAFFSLFVKITGSKILKGLLRYGAGFLKCLLLLATEVEFIGVVIHATGIGVHLLGALLVKFFQPGNGNTISHDGIGSRKVIS